MKEVTINSNEQILKTLNEYSYKMDCYTDNSNLFRDVFKLSKEALNRVKDEIADNYLTGSIRILRYVIAVKLERNEIKSPLEIGLEIEKIKKYFNSNEYNYFEKYIGDKYPEAVEYVKNYRSKSNDAFRNWKSYYRYLLPFIYSYDDREKVWNCLKELIASISKDLNIESDYECISTPNRWGEKIKSYFGFEGPSNYGSKVAALMIHPKVIPDHKNAIQFFCRFEAGEVQAGWEIGWNLSKDIIEQLNLPDHNLHLKQVNSYLELIDRLVDIKNIVIDANKELLRINSDSSQLTVLERNAEEEEDKEETVNLFDINEKGETEQVSDIIVSSKMVNEIPSDEDYLNRDMYAKYFADVIKERENKSQLSIGIYAPWGEGKTQFINLIKKNISKKDKIEFIDFDAWQYDDQEHIWAALVMAFMRKCEKNLWFYLKYLWWKFCKIITYENFLKLGFWLAALYWFIPTFLSDFGFLIKLTAHPIIFAVLFTLLPGLIKHPNLNINNEFLQCIKTPTYDEHLGFRNDIKELIDLTLKHLTANNHRAVLVIDNLDRCSQDNIVKILDSINQFLTTCTNNKNYDLATIFALDYEIVKAAIRKKLKSDSNELIKDRKAEIYLDKIISIPFYLPLIDNHKEFLEKSLDENNKDIIDFIEYILKQPDAIISPRTIRIIMNKLVLLKNLQQNQVLSDTDLVNRTSKEIACITGVDVNLILYNLGEYGLINKV